MAKTRMRTVSEAFKQIKQMDKDTAVNCNFIRRLCLAGKIHSCTLGKKVLLNYDELLEYLHISEEEK